MKRRFSRPFFLVRRKPLFTFHQLAPILIPFRLILVGTLIVLGIIMAGISLVVVLLSAEATTTQPPALPHRTGPVDSIQGLYSQLDCHNQPGKRPSYVTVEGQDGLQHSFFLQCVGLFTHTADDDSGPGMDPSSMAKTDPVWILIRQGEGIVSLPSKVPHLSGGTPLLCFRIGGQQYVDCFYRNDETGQVMVKHIQSTLSGV
jgi:hypothetical protein